MEKNILEFASVTGSNKKFHLQDVSFSLLPGYIYAVTGENGAGKTTLMNHILEENSRYTGTIFYQGKDIRGQHTEIMQTIGFVSEDHIFFEDRTCDQNAHLFSMLYDAFDMDLFHDVLKAVELHGGKSYCKMSRGERMKFQLAFAIAHHSRLYLLDEATAGMDPVFRIQFFDMLRDILRNEENCVLMTSHNITEIEKNTDYAAVMKNGRLSPFTESLEGISHVSYASI